MSAPVSYDVRIEAIATYCLDVVAATLGTPASELRPVGFDIVKFPDGRLAGRVTLAAAPTSPDTFEPGERS